MKTLTARWLQEVRRQLRRGRHVVVHGNVRDFALLDGDFLPFRDALDQVLADCGYTLRAAYNLADGITFAEPEMRARFEALERDPSLDRPGGGYRPPASRAGAGANPSAGSAGAQVPPAGGGGANAVPAAGMGGRAAPEARGGGGAPGGYRVPGAAVPPAASSASPPSQAQAAGSLSPRTLMGPPLHLEPDLALPAFRRVLAEGREEGVSAVLDFSDKLIAGGENQSPAERALLVTLSLAATEAHRQLHGSRAGMRNALVLVAASLGQIPAWIYRDNPFFQVISVERPSGDERREFLSQQYAGFFGARSGDSPPEALQEEFAGLTDGLSHWDLEAVRLTSFHERLPITECRKLVDFFKHGTREDPWENLNLSLLRGARESLRRQVMGQDAAIEAVLNVLICARGGVQLEGPGRRSARPKGVLFFVGPTGVGKTELAKSVTELIFHDPTAFARFDMSEYQQEHAAERLTGAPPSYVGYEAGGQLTNRMKARPFSLILFDEIEKAHPRIMDKFLQVLDDGRLTDGLGETVYFSQSLIIFTSNIGSTRLERGPGGELRPVQALRPDMTPEDLVSHYRREVRDHFIRIGRPELLGRIGEENVVVFDMLRPEHVAGILQKFLQGVAASVRERYRLDVVFETSVTELAIETCSRPEAISMGGRGIRNFVQSQVLVAVNEAVLQEAPGRRTLRVMARDGRVVAE